MDIDDLMGCGLSLLVGGIGIAILVAVVFFIVDSKEERKAYPAMAACRAQRMEPYRKLLDHDVTCIPVNARQDTTTYNLNVKQ